ncbi:MAG TPA: carbohydrate-binding protein, partial [Lentzea sp.]
GGAATLSFGYANGTTVSRPLDVTVNGTLARDELAFAGTGAWTTYLAVQIPVTLQAGENKIRATATTANGAPNLDYLDVG